jgi:hypothetical protein
MSRHFTLSLAITAALSASLVAQSDEPTKPPAKTDSPPATAPVEQPRIDAAAELLGRLKPEQMMTFADIIEQDWPQRPEWAEMALAVMRGQAMMPGRGWWRASEKKYGWTWLKRKYDKNSDNVVQRDEFQDSSPAGDLYFKRLDRDLDGKLSTADFDVSIFQGDNPAAAKTRMSEFLLFHFDTDSNGQVTQTELADFFKRADQEKSAFLTTEDLLEALDDGGSRESSGESFPSIPEQLKMFLAGQMGWFEEGPKLGDLAPDFKLSTHDNGRTIGLADSKDKKPIVLIFGSFT